jgi:AcrR family transcriptional regulator
VPKRKPSPKPRHPRPTKPSLKADGETEQRILEAARRVFIRRGTAGARMQEIAAEAGVNQALLHYYFRTKERLSSAVFAQIASRIFPALVQILGGDRPLSEKVDALIAAYLDMLARNPFLPGYLLAELHHHPERVRNLLATATGARPEQIFSPVKARIAAQIQAEVTAGRMRPMSPEQFIVNLVSLCIFPFAARPLLGILLELDDSAFAQFIEERKTLLPAYVHSALRP